MIDSTTLGKHWLIELIDAFDTVGSISRVAGQCTIDIFFSDGGVVEETTVEAGVL